MEGKKTILYELAQQFSWDLPDVILFPTGGGTGIVGRMESDPGIKDIGMDFPNQNAAFDSCSS